MFREKSACGVLSHVTASFSHYHSSVMPIPVVERSKAWVCGWSPTGIAGSNPAGGMDVCVLCVL